MGITSAQLHELQAKIVKKIEKKLGYTPSETGDYTRFNNLDEVKLGEIMRVAAKVCQKYSEKNALRLCNEGNYIKVETITVVGVYEGRSRVTVFNF